MTSSDVHIVTVAGSDNLYLLDHAVSVRADGWLVKVKPGLTTDGASIPRTPLIRLLIGDPMQGRLLRAAVVHDALYQAQLLGRDVSDRMWRCRTACRVGRSGWSTAPSALPGGSRGRTNGSSTSTRRGTWSPFGPALRTVTTCRRSRYRPEAHRERSPTV
jgi:hypothetical protein